MWRDDLREACSGANAGSDRSMFALPMERRDAPTMTGVTRRQSLRYAGLAGIGYALGALVPAWARSAAPGLPVPETVSGNEIALTIAETSFTVHGRTSHAISVNGTVPAPLVRLREGQTVRIAVTNELDQDTSIHWHGVILPFQMDGVPV
jgi:FtsP/CotA-like multicopper oxidase with cupredoxin domain